jgi:DnaJ-class molecular chaperone
LKVVDYTCFDSKVQKDATQQEIRASFKKLSLQYHPDKADTQNKAEAEKIFKEINDAYATLGDADKRF